MNAPVAFLFGIPNQPLFDGKKEDALIAETFVRYLETKDGDWPLLFPMTKSLVRAMDALQAFTEKEWQHKTTGFVVSGASKRGWTTWLTAAADGRVKAIAPLVIDTLNIPAQLPNQVKSFGTYSEMIGDYTRRGLVPMPKTDAARALWVMTDPYSYREKLTLPKFIVVGANDPYWTVDALNAYWDGLKGDKWVSRVPNAGHDLQRKLPDGTVDRLRGVESLAAFARAQIHGKELAKATWVHDDADGKARLTVKASATPAAARLWVVDAPTRDFRKATWVERPAAVDGTTATAAVEMPAGGCRAFYGELDYDLDGLTYRVATQVRVLGNSSWVVTASGLRYADEAAGTGAAAKPGDTVEVHYTGTFKDGKKFDGSRDANEPYRFKLGAAEVIKGWDEGITGMKVGGKRRLAVPPELAYGKKGSRDGVIPPDTELSFEVELMAIK
jgi:PhoPQ-activated pathogenicity-related protein